jgi:hypothetical protein
MRATGSDVTATLCKQKLRVGLMTSAGSDAIRKQIWRLCSVKPKFERVKSHDSCLTSVAGGDVMFIKP